MSEKTGNVYFNVLRNVLSFIAVIFSAHYFKWETRDLLWSLWISSLSVGTVVLISGFAGTFFFNRPVMSAITKSNASLKAQDINSGAVISVFSLMPVLFVFKFSAVSFIFISFAVISISALILKKKNERTLSASGMRLLNFLINFPAAIFMMSFFAVHFGGFHFIHSIFLNMFFPLLAEQPFGKNIEGTFMMFLEFIRVSFSSYWIFILSCLISSFGGIVTSFKGINKNFMFEPYKNVTKMHLMIFVIAFLGSAHLNNYILYTTLIIYFFPFELFSSKKEEKNEEGAEEK